MTADGLVAWLRGLRRGTAAEDARLHAVCQAVTAALDSVDDELATLGAQLQADRDRACLALDNEDGSRFEREPADEQALCDAEDRVRAGAARMSRLRALRATFGDMRRALEGAGAPRPPAADARDAAQRRPRRDAAMATD